MAVLDTIYRAFMFIIPYALTFAAYIWVGKKAWRIPDRTVRIISLAMIAAGVGFTVYRLVSLTGRMFTNDLFEYIVLLVMVGDLALVSIIMAIGEPER